MSFKLVIITFIALIFFCYVFYVWVFGAPSPKDKILDKWIKKGLESGIKEINSPSITRINIYFNNGIKLLNTWDVNKYYSWLSEGELYIDEYKYHFNGQPSNMTMFKLGKAIRRYHKEKLEEVFGEYKY